MGLFAGTEFDRPPRCERCDKLETECQCLPEVVPLTPPNKQTARIRVEKRKRGKEVTVVQDLRNEQSHLTDLLTQLKNHCGAGGNIAEGMLEIQGNQLDRIRGFLNNLGYKTRG